MKKRLQSQRAMAYHEAGHAVACFYNGVRLQTVSIVPNTDSLGRVDHRNILHKCDIEWDTSTKNRLRMERLVRVSLAGPAAQRRFARRSCRAFHGSDDYRQAVDLVSYFSGSAEHCGAYVRLLEIEADGLFTRPVVWGQVTALANALLEEPTLSAKRVRAIVRGRRSSDHGADQSESTRGHSALEARAPRQGAAT